MSEAIEETEPTMVAVVPPYDKRLAREYVSALEAGKAAYEKADEALRKLHERHDPGFQVPLPDGRTVELTDNFATSNVAWNLQA